MTICKVNDSLKKELMLMDISVETLDNCLNSKFVSTYLDDGKIVGVCFVGGILNFTGIEIVEKYRGKGIGKILLNEIKEECKKQKISFLTGVFKPKNLPSIKIHVKIGFRIVFTVYYNKIEGKEIIAILPFNKKGRFVMEVIKIGNLKIGNFCFVLSIKLLRPFMTKLLTFSTNIMPKVDLLKSIKNFEKVETTIQLYNLDIN